METAGVATKGPHRLGHSDAVRIDQGQVGRVERPGEHFAAEICGMVAHALFISKPWHLDTVRQAPPEVVQALHACYGDEHSQWPVVLTGVAHGVEVGSKEERFWI